MSSSPPYDYGPRVPPDGESTSSQDPYPFYPPAPQYAAPQYGPPPYLAPAASNGMAVAGLVLGILAAVFFWASFFDLPFVVLGVVFSSIGLHAAKWNGASGRGMAISGLVCAIVGGVLATLVTIVYINS